MGEIERRKLETAERIEKLKALLDDAERTLQGKACIYATGSYGRGDATTHSDLDAVIVGLSKKKGDKYISHLSGLDEICVKADLIRAVRETGIKEFDGGGKYLTHHSIHDFTATLGHPQDDLTNTFTSRLLLILESTPISGSSTYCSIIEEAISAYWKDFSENENAFIPGFLANDILRLWRTLCINYEVRTDRAPGEPKSKRKLKNFKLKHSRLLTCFSSLVFLLTTYRLHGTVTPGNAISMTRLTPLERLHWCSDQGFAEEFTTGVENLTQQYEQFLVLTNFSEPELVKRFSDPESYKAYKDSAYDFGNTMYSVVNLVGAGNLFHRILTI